ncbi:MAG TPA: oligosaccharide flippase family protein [Blastocatellia bacterium]|nr:oligosaccharide flippase family protein [Blastocatellia bacterium]
MKATITSTNPSSSDALLLRRAAWLVWSGVVNVANSVLLWMVLARWREAAEVGRFTIAISIYLTFVGLCSLGLGPYLVSEITRRKEQQSHLSLIASATAFLVSASIGFAVLMCATGFVVSDAREVQLTTALLSLALLPTGLIVTAEAVFIANGRTRVIALANTLENLFRTVVPLLLVLAGARLALIGLSFVGARVLACLVYAWAARGTWSHLFSAQRREMVALNRATPTFAGITIFSALHWQIATLLLGRLGSEEAAAQFGVASRFLVPVAVLLASYTSVLQPEATRRAALSLAALGEFLSRSSRVVLMLALPFVAGIWLLAREALMWLFGAQYGEAAVVLGLLGTSALPLCLAMLVARGLVATNCQRVDLLANVAGVLTCGLFGLLLIPSLGATGAAAAHLLSLLVLAGIEIVYATRNLFKMEIGKTLLLCSAPLLVMSAVVWQVRAWGLWSAILLGAAIYLALVWLLHRRPAIAV